MTNKQLIILVIVTVVIVGMIVGHGTSLRCRIVARVLRGDKGVPRIAAGRSRGGGVTGRPHLRGRRPVALTGGRRIPILP